MFRLGGLAIAVVSVTLVVLTVQSASVVNQLKVDSTGHLENVKEPSKQDDHSREAAQLDEAAAPMQVHDGRLEETDVVVGGSVGIFGRRRRRGWLKKAAADAKKKLKAAAAAVKKAAADTKKKLEAAAAAEKKARQITSKSLMIKVCDKCAQESGDWRQRHTDACRDFSYFSKAVIRLPQFRKTGLDTWFNDKCFYPAMQIFPVRKVVLDRPRFISGIPLLTPEKIKKTCACLKKLVGPDDAQACKSQECTKSFVCNCKGLCKGFKQRVAGFCTNDASLAETNVQNHSAMPEPKALMRSERISSDRTEKEQVLMRQEATQESKQESGTLDETLEDKCPSQAR